MSRPADPTAVFLVYVGPRAVSGAPARDLTRHDVARIAYRRALSLTTADGIRPPQPDATSIRETAADLVGRGPYRRAQKELSE